VWQYIQSTPLAGQVAAADAELRAALERDAVQGWQPWVVKGGMEYEQEIIVAVGRR
jgi:hypothetical protein